MRQAPTVEASQTHVGAAGATETASLQPEPLFPELLQPPLEFDIDEAYRSIFPFALSPDHSLSYAPWSDPDFPADHFGYTPLDVDESWSPGLGINTQTLDIQEDVSYPPRQAR